MTSPAIAEPDLDPRLLQAGPLGELLPGVNVRILGALEGLLQLLQLLNCKRRSATALLPFQGYSRLARSIGIVRTT